MKKCFPFGLWKLYKCYFGSHHVSHFRLHVWVHTNSWQVEKLCVQLKICALLCYHVRIAMSISGCKILVLYQVVMVCRCCLTIHSSLYFMCMTLVYVRWIFLLKTERFCCQQCSTSINFFIVRPHKHRTLMKMNWGCVQL